MQLSSSERQTLKDWLQADYQIYDHYVQRLQEQVDQFNRMHVRHLGGCTFAAAAMQEEVVHLQEANTNLKNRCVLDFVGNEQLRGAFQETSNDTMGFVVDE